MFFIFKMFDSSKSKNVIECEKSSYTYIDFLTRWG